MSTPADRIRNLVDAKKVSAEEGERLLRAMTPSSGARSSWLLLLNPFDRFGGERAAVAGLAISALSLGLARLGVHFDGALDVHLAPSANRVPLTLGASLLEQAAGWLVASLLFWAYARFTSSHVRFVDFLGVVGLSRVLLLGIALFLVLGPELPPDMATKTPTPALLAHVLVLAAVTLPLIGWFITLLYQGFKNASGLAGGRLVGGFIGVLLVSEIVSKLVLLLPH